MRHVSDMRLVSQKISEMTGRVAGPVETGQNWLATGFDWPKPVCM